MAVLSKEQVENIKTCLNCGSLDCHTTLGCKIQLEIKCTKNTENLIDTIEHLQYENERYRETLIQAGIDVSGELREVETNDIR